MTARQRFARNPFYVLGLAPGASRAALEEQAQKLLGMLELGLAGAGAFATPLGPEVRTADDVRAAVAELRDPARRLRHELRAELPPVVEVGPEAVVEPGWSGAFAALGFVR